MASTNCWLRRFLATEKIQTCKHMINLKKGEKAHEARSPYKCSRNTEKELCYTLLFPSTFLMHSLKRLRWKENESLFAATLYLAHLYVW